MSSVARFFALLTVATGSVAPAAMAQDGPVTIELMDRCQESLEAACCVIAPGVQLQPLGGPKVAAELSVKVPSRPIASRTGVQSTDGPIQMECDVVYLADFTQESDALLRAVEEVRLNAALGYRTGLVHLGSNDGRISPAIMEIIDCELGLSLDYDTANQCKLAIVLAPQTLVRTRPKLPFRLVADRTIAILDTPAPARSVGVLHARLMQLLGENITWSATAYDGLAQLRNSGLPATGTIWQPFGAMGKSPERQFWTHGSSPIVGTAAGPGLEHWPASEVIRARVWDRSRYRIRVIGTPPRSSALTGWEVVPTDARQHIRLVAGLAAFLYYPEGRPDDLPLTAIGTCLAAEIPVFLAPHLRDVIGTGPHYVAPTDLPQRLAQGISSPHPTKTAFDPIEVHRRRMRFLIGEPTAPAVHGQRRKRAMLFSSNGDGLGHVTRLIGVARRLPDDVDPIFVTLSSGIGVVEQAGFDVEMILSHRYANIEPAAAYGWMAEELKEMLARHRPDAVVFDGGNPYVFLSEVVATRRGPAYLWLRRGMWQAEQDNQAVLAREKLFDAILEPRDLAEAFDRGATAHRREGVVLTDPIRIIDADEQLPKAKARRELGLDPKGIAVLIQLGAGNARDVSNAYHQVVATMLGHPDVQLVNLVPPISQRPPRRIEGIRNISVYPAARYLQAFDFAISAAGYNSFHELAFAGIPTIFVVTMRPELDDQLARARYAEAGGFGFALSSEDLSALPQAVDAMLDRKRRAELASNAGRLAMPNGAARAAEVIAEFCQ